MIRFLMNSGLKNLRAPLPPSDYYSGEFYDHDTSSEDYQMLIDPICEAIAIFDPWISESILEHCFELLKELADVYRGCLLDNAIHQTTHAPKSNLDPIRLSAKD